MSARKVKKYSSWGYVGKITVNARLEEVNVVVTGKTSCPEFVPNNVVLGKNLSQRNFLLTNAIRREGE